MKLINFNYEQFSSKTRQKVGETQICSEILQNLMIGKNLTFWRYLSGISILIDISFEMNTVYDLIIVGAGCLGVAAAQYASSIGQSVCLIESQQIDSETRYWSSSFSARQNRVQYSEEYLTRYVVESNKYWKEIEKQLGQKEEAFLKKEGALWFGDKTVSTSEGNIKAANAVITQINAAEEGRIDSLYMEKLMKGVPDFMKAFKPYDLVNSSSSEWDSWSALFQPDGGSVDMKASYTAFLNYIRAHKVTIFDQTQIKLHSKVGQNHIFEVLTSNKSTTLIVGKKILLTVGVYTPFFLNHIMKEPYLANNAPEEFVIQEYVASYMKIEDSDEARQVFDNLPNYYNFLDQTQNAQSKQKQYSAYGFRFHQWDNLDQNVSRYVKFGTMANKGLTEGDLIKPHYGPIATTDQRVAAAKRYVRDRMNYLLPDDTSNVHYPCPIIFYSGRETLLDYLNRTDETIVVQSGGWIGKYYPLLAKTAVDMLVSPAKTRLLRAENNDVIGNFINRTRFPITSRVNQILQKQSSQTKLHFTNAIIGGGCSGLYAAYRLNKQRNLASDTAKRVGNIGVFELSDRISGRLKSFKFVGTTTPMELGGMRYIPTNHILVNHIINELGIPSINFNMSGDPIQQAAKLAYLRNDFYRMDEWSKTQQSKFNLHTAYRIEGPIVGMDSFQIISYSLYMILKAPENINLLTEVFLKKTDGEIGDEKNRLNELGENVHYESSWYRNYNNYIFQDTENPKIFNIGLSLKQWNDLKPILLIRFRYTITDKEFYLGQEPIDIEETYPLYKFGFQNVLEAQFGHEAYQFVSQQNGYFSNVSNASYLDQVMTYLLDFGNVSYRTLATGFDQINYAMANELLSKNGLRSDEGIFLHHKLVDILLGSQYGKKYVLVFHVPLNKAHRSLFHRTKIQQSKMRSRQDVIPPLGVITEIPGTDYGEIRFTADRIILGMPKKSVSNLAYEIEILRKPIQQDYKILYNEQKLEYYNIFKYLQTQKYIAEGIQAGQFTTDEETLLQSLLAKQEKSFHDESVTLEPQDLEDLQRLSRKKLVNQVKPVVDPEFQNKKEAKFDDDPPLMPKDLLKLADTTQLMPAMKIVMNFDRSWWDPNIRINAEYAKTYKNTQLVSSVQEMRGVSVTDLPARQALYFSNGPDNMLLASYNDMITTEFWTTLHNNFSKVWEPTNKRHLVRRSNILKADYLPSMDIHPAKKVLVKEILKQLSLMHQLEVKQEWVKECIYQFWGNDPYGAGYHNFYSGYFIPTVMKSIRKPWKNEAIHIVGEAYSNQTGWVEGAFQTTELLLQQELKCSELVPGYYAGY